MDNVVDVANLCGIAFGLWLDGVIAKGADDAQTVLLYCFEVGAARVEDGGEVPYLGERLSLRVTSEPGRVRDHVARHGHELQVAVADQAPRPQTECDPPTHGHQ